MTDKSYYSEIGGDVKGLIGDGDDVVAVERNIPASVYRAFRCWGCK